MLTFFGISMLFAVVGFAGILISMVAPLMAWIIGTFISDSRRQKLEDHGFRAEEFITTWSSILLAFGLVGVWFAAGLVGNKPMSSWYMIVGLIGSIFPISLIVRVARGIN